MNRHAIPSAAALAAAAKRDWNAEVSSLRRLRGKAHSINFLVSAAMPDGKESVFVLKCVPSGVLTRRKRLLEHLKSVKSPNAVRALFGGAVAEAEGWSLLALEAIEGETVMPETLSGARLDAFLAAHGELLAGFADDGMLRPAFPAAETKRDLMRRFGGDRTIAGLLASMDDATLVPPPESLVPIHGDLHWDNFKLCPDGRYRFFDLEEIRLGLPAEDLTRYFACRAEHMHWWNAAGRKRLLDAFAETVAKTGRPAEEWMFAINGYFLRKLAKKLAGCCGRAPFAVRANLAFRGGFYAAMRLAAARAAAPFAKKGPKTVKIAGGTVSRFIGKGGFLWNGGYFFTSSPACTAFDWFCVYDELPSRRPEVRRGAVELPVPRSRTLLATQEPASIKHYNGAYLRQFGTVLTNRPPEELVHPHRVDGAGYMVWYTGRSFAEERSRPLPEKTKVVSAVYSAKRMRHTMHAARWRLLEAAAAKLPGLELFGKGVRPVENKWEALDPYRYHIAFENHVGPGHWTEKIADALVCGCLPFYAGDPALADVLPGRSFIPVPADDPERAVAIMAKAIADGEREKRLDAILEARELLFSKYNLFAETARAIEAAERELPAGDGGGTCRIATRRRLRVCSPAAAAEDLLWHLKKTWRSFAGKGKQHHGG